MYFQADIILTRRTFNRYHKLLLVVTRGHDGGGSGTGDADDNSSAASDINPRAVVDQNYNIIYMNISAFVSF